MSYQVLARKWRPQQFNEMVGQTHVVTALTNALDSGRLHHGYLFTGTRGVGKTTLARLFAKSLNCEQGISSTPCGECMACQEIVQGRHVDLIEVDAASRTKVEDTRELLDNVQYAPTRGRFKIYLIDEVHMLSNHSFNALLKTLEEPPEHVKFLLATTDPQKLPMTVLSRCLQFSLKALSAGQLEKHLAHVLGLEQIEFELAALSHLAEAARGSARDSLSLLDQAIAYCQGTLTAAEVANMLGLVDSNQVINLIEALLNEDAQTLLEEVQRLADAAVDFSAVLSRLQMEFHQIAMAQQFAVAYADQGAQELNYAAFAARLTAEQSQLYYQMLLVGKRDLPWAPNPRLGFEMTLLRMLSFTQAEAQSDPSADGERKLPRRHGSSSSQPSADLASQGSAARALRESAAPYLLPQEPPRVPLGDDCPSVGVLSQSSQVIGPGLSEEHWAELVPQLGLSGMAAQLALHSRLTRESDSHWVLLVDPSQLPLLGTQSESRLLDALRGKLGQGIRISIQASEQAQETPFKRAQQAAQDKLGLVREELQQDPNLNKILNTFEADFDQAIIQTRE